MTTHQPSFQNCLHSAPVRQRVERLSTRKVRRKAVGDNPRQLSEGKLGSALAKRAVAQAGNSRQPPPCEVRVAESHSEVECCAARPEAALHRVTASPLAEEVGLAVCWGEDAFLSKPRGGGEQCLQGGALQSSESSRESPGFLQPPECKADRRPGVAIRRLD